MAEKKFEEEEVKSKLPTTIASSKDPNQCTEIFITTWNINAKHIEKDKSKKGFAAARNVITKKYVTDQPLMLYCIQEPQVKRPEAFKDMNFSLQDSISDGAIACPNEEFESGNGLLKVSYKDPPAKGSTNCAYQSTSQRYYCREITIHAKYQFILVSHHEQYSNKTDETIKKSIIDFCSQMCKVANDHKMTVIVGGDFNLDVEKWKSEVEEKNKERVCVAEKYGTGNRRNGKPIIDTFMIVYPDPSKVSNYTVCTMDRPFAVNFEMKTPTASGSTSEPFSQESATAGGRSSENRKPDSQETVSTDKGSTETQPDFPESLPTDAGSSQPQNTIKIDGSLLQAIAQENKMKDENAPSADELFKMMDHDPVVVKITLRV